eukprot:TRINITY_DN96_c0_g4_i6.p1 TRINITY_DN96_c0_g4~~TRINITY_DN96_c0_g4_i6.p1  ORF type:complete len:239 (+),score=41.30 TRINITY_DN96_c0_g4_i6:173-889(+)
MYPRINEFVAILHSRAISTFVVTNAQMPDALRALAPVTQLYLSIDAACRETLQKIDQPLFPDFWERYLACMDILASKKQRTVYRITLVKGWNFDPPGAYAALVRRGKPHFVECKGATYCGGKDNPLTLANIPWHDDVLAFARELERELGGEYAMASEHMHSCCVLLAHTSLRVGGQWRTWIDQDRFMSLVGGATGGGGGGGGGAAFCAADYSTVTPEWALFGSGTRGLSPADRKVSKC